MQHLPYGWTPSRKARVDVLFSLVLGTGVDKPNEPARSTTQRRRFNLLYEDAILRERTLVVDDVFERLEADIRLRVAEHAKGRVFVHAGVVGWNGRAILIPGRSFSGKSTLVSALVRAGAEYYSDEYAVLDARGRVHPYLKPVSLREEGETRQTHVTVEELGGVSGTEPVPVAAIVVAKYVSGAVWRPRVLTPGRGVLALLANTVPARRDPEKVIAVLTHVLGQAVAVKSNRPDAEDVVDAIIALVTESSATNDRRTHRRQSAVSGSGSSAASSRSAKPARRATVGSKR